MESSRGSGSTEPAGSGRWAALIAAALIVLTTVVVVVAQGLRREGTVFSATKVRALDRPEAESDLPGRELKICFRLNRDDKLDVELTDGDGSLVRVLAEGEELEGDERHCFRWDGRSDSGEELPGGRYRLRISLERSGRTAVAGERVRLAELTDAPDPEANGG